MWKLEESVGTRGREWMNIESVIEQLLIINIFNIHCTITYANFYWQNNDGKVDADDIKKEDASQALTDLGVVADR